MNTPTMFNRRKWREDLTQGKRMTQQKLLTRVVNPFGLKFPFNFINLYQPLNLFRTFSKATDMSPESLDGSSVMSQPRASFRQSCARVKCIDSIDSQKEPTFLSLVCHNFSWAAFEARGLSQKLNKFSKITQRQRERIPPGLGCFCKMIH